MKSFKRFIVESETPAPASDYSHKKLKAAIKAHNAFKETPSANEHYNEAKGLGDSKHRGLISRFLSHKYGIIEPAKNRRRKITPKEHQDLLQHIRTWENKTISEDVTATKRATIDPSKRRIDTLKVQQQALKTQLLRSKAAMTAEKLAAQRRKATTTTNKRSKVNEAKDTFKHTVKRGPDGRHYIWQRNGSGGMRTVGYESGYGSRDAAKAHYQKMKSSGSLSFTPSSRVDEGFLREAFEVPMDRVTQNKEVPGQAAESKGHYTTFASDIGLPPGKWPREISLGNETLQLQHKGSDGEMIYGNVIRTVSLTIYND